MKMIIDDTLFLYKLDTNFKKYIVKSMTYNYVSIEWEWPKNQGKLMSSFFNIEEFTILKGGKISNKYPAAFARDIACRFINKN